MKTLCLLPLLASFVLPVQNPPTAPPDGRHINERWPHRGHQTRCAARSDYHAGINMASRNLFEHDSPFAVAHLQDDRIVDLDGIFLTIHTDNEIHRRRSFTLA